MPAISFLSSHEWKEWNLYERKRIVISHTLSDLLICSSSAIAIANLVFLPFLYIFDIPKYFRPVLQYLKFGLGDHSIFISMVILNGGAYQDVEIYLF